MEKIIQQKDLENLKKSLKDKSIVTTNGTFDILHLAHIHILQKAKEQGDILIVLLNSDSSVKRNKGDSRPITPENERAEMLAALQCVDYVTIFKEDKPINTLKIIKPDIHIKGGSYIEERVKEEKELLESWNGKFQNFELEEGLSTTKIIDKIRGVENSKGAGKEV